MISSTGVNAVFGPTKNGFGANNADVDISFRFGEEEPHRVGLNFVFS